MSSGGTNQGQTQWAFVTTGPGRTRPSNAQRTLIRQQAMRDIGLSRRKPQSPTEEASTVSTLVDISGPVEPVTTSIDVPIIYNFNQPSSSTSVPMTLGPLILAPITLDQTSERLVHHMLFTDQLPSRLGIYRERWYQSCSRDEAAFHQMIASYVLHLTHLQRGIEKKLLQVNLRHHNKALSSVRKRLSDMQDTQLDTLVLAMGCFACHEHLRGNMSMWKVHMDAMNRLLQSRKAPFQTMDPVLVFLLRWVDTIGAYALDVPSVLDHRLIPLLEQSLGNPWAFDRIIQETSLSEILSRADFAREVVYPFEALEMLNAQVMEMFANRGLVFWSRPEDVDHLVTPVVRQLLSVSFQGTTVEQQALLACCRSGALVYLGEYRRRSGVPTVISEHVRKLQQFLEAARNMIILDKTLRIWLIAIGAMESIADGEREYFYGELAVIMNEEGIRSPGDLQNVLSEVLWSDIVFQGQPERVFNAVMATLQGIFDAEVHLDVRPIARMHALVPP